MYRPNYINTTPIQHVDPLTPYNDGISLTRTTHQNSVSTDGAKVYAGLAEAVFPDSFAINSWMRIDHIDGGHVCLLGARLASPEIAAGNFDTGILRTVSFSGLLHSNTALDTLHTFVWVGLGSGGALQNGGISHTRNYSILFAGGKQCSNEKSFILSQDNGAFDSGVSGYVVIVGFGIYNPGTIVADAVQCRFSLNAHQHLTEKPVFDPSRD